MGVQEGTYRVGVLSLKLISCRYKDITETMLNYPVDEGLSIQGTSTEIRRLTERPGVGRHKCVSLRSFVQGPDSTFVTITNFLCREFKMVNFSLYHFQ